MSGQKNLLNALVMEWLAAKGLDDTGENYELGVDAVMTAPTR